MTRFVPFLILAAALVACDIDFTEVTAPPDPPGIERLRKARLSVSMSIQDRPLPELNVSANLWPGTMEDGAVRGVSSETLYVGEHAILPRETSQGGVRSYRLGPAADAEHETLSVTAPVVEGLTALPPVLARTYYRVGADTLQAAPGDTLRFEVASHPAAAHEPSSTSWDLSLSSAGFYLHRSDTTAVPPVLTVPADWIAWAGTAPVHVHLSVREVWERELPDGEYSVRIGVSRELTWMIVWSETTE